MPLCLFRADSRTPERDPDDSPHRLPADMRKQVQDIFMLTPHDKQVMMFSATLSKEIRPVVKKFMSKLTTPPPPQRPRPQPPPADRRAAVQRGAQRHLLPAPIPPAAAAALMGVG